MKFPLSIVWLTNREMAHFDWFCDSLRIQEQPGDDIKIIVVDFYADADERRCSFRAMAKRDIVHVEPKPNVYQGKHRLTKEDWFAAANARNTGLCLAPDGWIAYCDDLAVLLPGWLDCIREAMEKDYVVLGAYKKVRQLQVEDGLVKSFVEHPGGVDTRLRQVTQDVTPCDGGWLYGCSLAGPTEAFLKVGGWPSDLCDSLGSEDCCMGKTMKNVGVDLRYDRRLMTYESDEEHGIGRGFKKADKGPAGTEADKSHHAIRFAEKAKYFFNLDDTPSLRKQMLAGGTWPAPKGPTHDWFNGDRIEEFE